MVAILCLIAFYLLLGMFLEPIGAMLLTYIDPANMRPAIGLLLVLYTVYALARPAFKPVQAGLKADVGIGVLNGLLGGLTGLVGIIVTIWCQLRGWPKDVQRGVFQPVMVAASGKRATSLAGFGMGSQTGVSLYAPSTGASSTRWRGPSLSNANPVPSWPTCPPRATGRRPTSPR